MRALLAQSTRPFPDWEWVGGNLDDIAMQLRQHVELTVLAVLIGLAIAFPLAVAALRWPRLHGPLLSITGALFTIPSLALFVLLVAAGFGLSRTSALIGLVLYTLLILFRNLVIGLTGVPAHVVEAAEAMGYRPGRLLWQVRLPLALPVVIAGIRIATVTTVGLVTVTELIGQGGLGQIFSEGFRRANLTATTAGFLLSVLLAVTADLLLVALERRLTPWTRRDGPRRTRAERRVAEAAEEVPA